MNQAAWYEHEEAAPESGVRVRARQPLPAPPLPSDAQVLGEVAGQVVGEVLCHLRVLAPLQGPWIALDLGQIGKAALTARCWYHLVPGYHAMDRLVSLLVDCIC